MAERRNETLKCQHFCKNCIPTVLPFPIGTKVSNGT